MGHTLLLSGMVRYVLGIGAVVATAPNPGQKIVGFFVTTMEKTSQAKSAHKQRSQAIAHRTGQQSQGAAFADNRASTVAQRLLAQSIQQSPQANQQRRLIARINKSPRMVAQRKQPESTFVRDRVKQDPMGTIQRKIEFARFTGRFSNWGWYNATEQNILNLASRSKELLTSLTDYKADSRFGRNINTVITAFDKLDNKIYSEEEYTEVHKNLKKIFYSADTLSTKIAKRDFLQEKDLDQMLEESFVVIDEQAKQKKPNELTAEELLEVKTIVNRVFRDEESNLNIQAYMPFGNLDLAGRAEEQNEEAPPPELLVLEIKILNFNNEWLHWDEKLEPLYKKLNSLYEKRDSLENPDSQIRAVKDKISEVKQKRDEFSGRVEELKADYEPLVKEMVKREVLRDLVTIAQTGVGRDLLKKIAKTSFETEAKKVTIRAYDQYMAPTAGQAKETGSLYVNYTPQYFRERDTRQRGEGGAILKAEELAKTNPWQENARTDISLFHELVHAYHHQSGTVKSDNSLVSAEKAVDEVDKPYGSLKDPKGVREEEYFTVGLGDYAEEKLTENAYRKERQQLDESVALREYYTHKDEEGRPISLEL